jgi:NAD(P)-dependent dehydrogenase (short-subunit alcohol dehydrogenase family)
MAEKDIVLITGANTGIGFETVKALVESSKPYHIFLGSRSVSRGDDALARLAEPLKQSASSVEVLEIDMESDETINKAAETVREKFGKLDALINNAG